MLWDKVELEKFINGLAWEKIEDRVWGKVGQGMATGDFQNRRGIPFGFGVGPWDNQPFSNGKYWDAEKGEWVDPKKKSSASASNDAFLWITGG